MGTGNKIEFLVAICALVASVMAVYIAWDQGRVMRAQQHGAVYPVLQVEGFVATSPEVSEFGMRVSNSGVGPALIESISLTFDGEPVDGFETQRRQLPAGYDLSWAGLSGRALAPGEDIIPLRVLWGRDDIAHQTLLATATDWGRFDVRICYCSVFKRCWQSQAIGTSRAHRVKKCPVDDTDVFAALGAVPAQVTTGPSEETE